MVCQQAAKRRREGMAARQVNGAGKEWLSVSQAMQGSDAPPVSQAMQGSNGKPEQPNSVRKEWTSEKSAIRYRKK